MFPNDETLQVVFDTNVLAAALRSKIGASFALIEMLPSPKFKLAISVPLYLEYLDVLMRPDIKPSNVSNADVLSFIRKTLDYSHKQSIYFRWRPWLKDFGNIESFGIEAILPSEFLEIVRKL